MCDSVILCDRCMIGRDPIFPNAATDVFLLLVKISRLFLRLGIEFVANSGIMNMPN